MSCNITEDMIYDYVAGNIDVVLAKKVEDHLKVCESCQSMYHTWLDIDVQTIKEHVSYTEPETSERLKRRVMATSKREKLKDSLFKQPYFLFASFSMAVVLLLIGLTVGHTGTYEVGDSSESPFE
ncbi:anti-sigma factor, partial [Pseudomonas sp. 2822-17]|uniref:anti-sigma factor family protein n=1 Tax=Pseudomonas sp. 2822-17 TaxID=1712678 RepID=UPI00117A6D8C